MYKECLLNLLIFSVLYERETALPAAAGKCRPCNLTNGPQITQITFKGTATMHKGRLVVLLTFAALCKGDNDLPAPAGKCRPCKLTYVPNITVEELVAVKPWRIIYASGTTLYGYADNEVRDAHRGADNKYVISDRRTMKDKSHNKYEFKGAMVDNVGIEEYIDGNGKKHIFYDYPMAVTSQFAILYYRCSDSGRGDIDMRIIEIPANRTLSEEELQYLLEVDRSCKFRGELHKLPEQFREDNS